MELKKAKEIYDKRKYGKCVACEHSVDKNYCLVRERTMYYSSFIDFLTINCCDFYKEKEK